jgi:tetratricopeptide (TPR) repeat protein
MKIALHSPTRKIIFLATSMMLVTVYIALGTRQLLADYLSGQLDLVSLQMAARLVPGNAEYQYRLGRYFLQTQHEPEAAERPLKFATALSPYNSTYWLELSRAYQRLTNHNLERDALQRAIAADPSTPDVAWDAANIYWSEGEPEKALQEFRVVMQTEPNLSPEVLDRCWRIKPDVGALLRDVIPPNSEVYSSFLDFLISRNEPAAAATVWRQMAQLQQPVETRHVFNYVQYLIAQPDIALASQVWRDAANISGLSDYQPSPENLVVNGDFNLPVLNGGFDWLYWKSPDVSLALDPTESHSGHHPLSIVFDSRGMEDAGIRQLIPVEPNSKYRFSAYFKSEGIEGAGGPRFLLQDQLSGAQYFASEYLKDADFWKQAGGTFSTGADTKLLILRIGRMPAGDAIRGKLWIDGLRLMPGPTAEASR